MNELYKESSPYLLQHANNPIHWKAWNPQTLTTAKQKNQLLVISIGYSTCHWCHVMEHESFEDQSVASLMNTHFSAIKIDREEHPDIDAHYMKAVQLMTKQGGWPLNVVCLPDGRPIWGGTYFKKEAWMNALDQLQQLYSTKPDTVEDFAVKLTEGINILGLAPQFQEESRFNLSLLVNKWSKSFDEVYGGYTRAPKFMMPTNLLFLQRYGHQTQDTDLLQHIDTTLTRMAWGGIFDPIEGGFSRYAVDHKWHIPHFEKMLYDNAQLLSVYAEGYCRTKNNLYKEVIHKTIQFIKSNWYNNQGGYYSALDADSLNANHHLEEGAYYVWTEEQLKELIQEDFFLFSQVFNINDFGYWEHNNYVLIQNDTLEHIAIKNKLTIEVLKAKKAHWEQTLLDVRKKRSAPRLDDKTITSWNMMLISGFVDAYFALEESAYLQDAQNLMLFATQNLWSETSGLFRIYKNGKVSIDAYLEDYAYFIQALLALYEATGESTYILQAKNMMDYTLDSFLDTTSGFFYYSKNNKDNISKHIETEDNVIPSSNAIMCLNLVKLGILYEHTFYTQLAEQMTKTICSQIDYPSAYSHWLIAYQTLNNSREISIVGTHALMDLLPIKQKYWDGAFIFPIATQSSIPYLKKYEPTTTNLFYKCENKTCFPPTNINEV